MKTIFLVIMFAFIAYGQGDPLILFYSEEADTLSEELLLNTTFDANTTGWGQAASIIKHYSSDYNSVGKVNTLLDSATATANAYTRQLVTITSGKSYYLVYSYYIPINTTTNGIIARFGTGDLFTNRLVVGAWTTVSEIKTATSDRGDIRFYQTVAGGLSGITAGDKIYIDNVSLKEILP